MMRCLLIWVTTLLTSFAGTACATDIPDFLMDSDPELRLPALVKNFTRDFKGFWLKALQRPEIDLQRMTADTVAKAHLYGIPGLIELVPELDKILTNASSHPSARFAAARALVVLESHDSAAKLFDAGQKYGADLRQFVEPALALWEFGPARAVWIKRLETVETGPRDLTLAIRGLAQVRDQAALGLISEIAMDLLQRPEIRLEAAAAAGAIVDIGLEKQAEQLSHENRTSRLVNRLCAVRILKRHSSEAAQRLLIELSGDAEASVAAPALNRLNGIDPELVVPMAESAMLHPDPHIREEGAKAYISLPTPERIVPLAQLLSDPHPAVRKMVRKELYQLAKHAELDGPIRQSAMQILSGQRWQGQEQATLLLGMLEHKPAADRFVELLESTRPEVMNCTAWGLRKLAVPRTIPSMMDKIQRQTVARKSGYAAGIDGQVAHLFEACGLLRAQAAQPLMLEYIPKDPIMGARSRAAAIWALGWLHVGVPDKAISDVLLDRFTDSGMMPPESEVVKQFSVISIGRMKVVDHAPLFRRFVANGTPPSTLGMALGWAVKELTGEEFSSPKPGFLPEGNWFLEPVAPHDADMDVSQ